MSGPISALLVAVGSGLAPGGAAAGDWWLALKVGATLVAAVMIFMPLVGKVAQAVDLARLPHEFKEHAKSMAPGTASRSRGRSVR